jgi:hypothetical protein
VTKLPPLEAIPGGHPDACLLPSERKHDIWRTKIAEIGAPA